MSCSGVRHFCPHEESNPRPSDLRSDARPLQNLFFIPRSWQDEKTSFLILHRAQNLPSLLFLSEKVLLKCYALTHFNRVGPHPHQFRQSKWIISTSPPPLLIVVKMVFSRRYQRLWGVGRQCSEGGVSWSFLFVTSKVIIVFSNGRSS